MSRKVKFWNQGSAKPFYRARLPNGSLSLSCGPDAGLAQALALGTSVANSDIESSNLSGATIFLVVRKYANAKAAKLKPS